jgi:DNA end-binding protein Ku
MATRSLSELTIAFGLVSIPVKMYSATETKDAVSFNLIHRDCGSRVRQQYFCVKEEIPVSRSDMVKGYEFEKDRYVTFEPDELKMLEEKGTHSIDIVSFVPADSIDPIYYDRGYYLGPAKRGERPYTLLLEGMKRTGRVALARWVSRGKAYTVQVRPIPAGGLILQQLLYSDEVRPFSQIGFEPSEIKSAELDLAVMLIEQSSQDAFDPAEYTDVVKERVLAAIEQKVQGKEITVVEEPERESGQIIDLMDALRASLAGKRPGAPAMAGPQKRKPVKRAPGKEPAEAPRKRASKK